MNHFTNPITLSAYVDESGHLEIELPDGFPAGRVEVTLQRIESDLPSADSVMNVQAQLETIGLLPPDNLEDVAPLSEDAIDRLVKSATVERNLAEELTEDEDEY